MRAGQHDVAAEAAALSRTLRTSDDPAVRRRRGIVGWSLVAAGAMGVIALYQTGIIDHLPEPPLPRLDADAVDASPEAYAKLSTPDAVLGLGSSAVTMTLAAMGGANRTADRPWLPLALAAKVGYDVVQAAKLSVSQWTRHWTFCSWCLTAAAATFAMLPLAIPDARAAVSHVRR